VPPIFANRYDIIGNLGQGGFGFVYRAHDLHLDRDVALKTFQRGWQLAAATYEAQRLTSLEGPHILRVFNADRYQDIPYLATEVAALGSAMDFMQGRGVRPDLAIRWIRHMLIGLQVCHQHHLLHRDVKPGNVFLQSLDLAQLGDFGVSDVMDAAGRTQPHGSWQIRAPEAYTHNVMTVESDIYSTGLALYTMLTGIEPYLRSTPAEMQTAVIAQARPPIRDIAPHVPRVLVSRVERALSTDPALRYPSAAAFHDDLGAIRHLANVFAPVLVHPGHLECWSGRAGTRELNVCVWAEGGGFEIEVRRSGGSHTRILDFCTHLPNQGRLRIELRRIFDGL